MKRFTKKTLSLIVIVGLILGMTACSSSTTTSGDIVTDTSKMFSAINRVEKFTPGGMNFTKDQAEQILAIINPVVNGAIYTTGVAEDIFSKVNKLLTNEQKDLINKTIASLGVPIEGAVPGSGAGQGGGMGGTGATGTPPTSGSIGDAGINMFLRVDQILTDNYLN